MIIKGKPVSGRGLAAHLERADNERIEFLGMRGGLSGNIRAAVQELRELGFGQRCKRPLYHAQINPHPDDRSLTAAELARALEIFEKENGYENQPRAIEKHTKKGREHYHVIYSRIRPDGRTVSDSWNYYRHEKAARRIERALDLIPERGRLFEHSPDIEQHPRPPSHDEMQQAARLGGRDPREVKAQIRQLYARADNAAAFVAELEAHGFTLAKGDRRDFVLIEKKSGQIISARAIGARAAELRAFFGNLAPAANPPQRVFRAGRVAAFCYG